jgi:hypothetical protein
LSSIWTLVSGIWIRYVGEVDWKEILEDVLLEEEVIATDDTDYTELTM